MKKINSPTNANWSGLARRHLFRSWLPGHTMEGVKILWVLLLLFPAFFMQGQAFVTKWVTTSPNESITINTGGGTYDYTINWGDGTVENLTTFNPSHTYVSAGTHTVSITGKFPHISINGNNPNRLKIVSIDSWGDIKWTSLFGAFNGCSNLVYNATDAPVLDSLPEISCQRMFVNCSSFNGDLSNWDVSHVSNMSEMFEGATIFNGNISGWSTDTLQNASRVFSNCPNFNQPLNNWDMADVTNMQRMFDNAFAFNQPLDNWDMSSVTTTSRMFANATAFNSSLSGWNMPNCTTTNGMFNNASAFNQDINNWTLGMVDDMDFMFTGATVFNQPINSWDVSSVTGMFHMFDLAFAFNQSLNDWDVSNVKDMARMFQNATSFNGSLAGWQVTSLESAFQMFNNAPAFNQPINSWGSSTGSLLNANNMFRSATSFNQPLGNWDVSSVTNMGSMFDGAASFNQPLDSWDITSVTSMANMFANASSFNQSLNSWDVSGVQNMSRMFTNADSFNGDITGWTVTDLTNANAMFGNNDAFNQPIGNWGASTANLQNCQQMFADATAFDQSLGNWDISSVNNLLQMFNNAGMGISAYDNTLIGWAAQTVQPNETVNAFGLQYCAGEAARQSLIDDDGWSFVGDVKESEAPVAVCPTTPVEVFLDGTGNGTLAENALALGQSPADCSGPVIETNPLTNFDCSHLGFQAVLLTVTDSAGNMATVNCDVLIRDTIPPTILTCPADTVIAIMTGDCAAEFELTLPTMDDNCGAEAVVKINNAAPFPALFIGEYKGGLNATLSEVYGDGTSSLIKNTEGAGGLVMDSDSTIIVAISGLRPAKLLRINLFNNTCDTLATAATLPAWIEGIDVDDVGNVVVAGTLSGKIYQVNIATKVVTELASGFNNPADVVYETPSSLLITEFFGGRLTRYDLNTNMSTVLTSGLIKPRDILQLNNGKILVTEDTFISEIDSISGAKTVISPDLSGTKPLGLALGNNNNLYIALEFDARIIEMDLMSGDTTTFASGLHRPRFIINSPNNSLPPNVHTLVWEAIDTSGNKDMCTQQVTITSTSCPNEAEVLDFDGVDDYVDLGVWNPHSAAGFTHEAWVYAENLGPDDFSNSVILQEGPSGTSTILRCGQNGPNNVRASFHHSGGLYDLDGVITTDTWQHLAMTWDPVVDTFYLYVNGILADKIHAPNPPNTVAEEVWIGNSEIAPNRWWDGRLDEVRVWDHYRTQAQILANMLCELHGTEAGLLAYYNFNQGDAFLDNLTVTTLSDVTGNHDGTLQNFALTVGDNSNWIEPGPLLGAPKSNGFITTWEATLQDLEITIPTFGSYSYNYTVNWGDGIVESGLSGDATHAYAAPGTYTVSIDGVFPAIYLFDDANNAQQLRSIEQWGNIEWASFTSAFENAQNMALNATDAPDLSNVHDMSSMFYNCSNFTGDLDHWDVSNVNLMGYMFSGSAFNGDVSNWNTSLVVDMGGLFQATPFNGSLENWDVSFVLNMAGMFDSNTAFNQPLDNWERVGSSLSNVVDMKYMFFGATAFNQDISNWNVSSVESFNDMFDGATSFNQPLNTWNVGSALEMQGMFYRASAFDQPLNNWDVADVKSMFYMFESATSFNQDISGWTVSNVLDMGWMFNKATAFNQPLGNWDITNVTRMASMFDSCGVDLANYDATLSGWAAQTPKIGVQLGAANMRFCASLLERKKLDDDFGWAFIGDAQDPSCLFGGPAESLCFDGVDDYVELPANLTADYEDFTFMAWYYCPSDVQVWERIMDFGENVTKYMMLTVNSNFDLRPRFGITNTTQSQEDRLTSPDPLVPDQWYHFAVTIDGSADRGTLYINGEQKDQIDTMALSPSHLGNLPNNWLGRSQWVQDTFLSGYLDEVSIWNVPLDSAQVVAYMNNELNGNEGGLQHYYQFNQGIAFGNNVGLDTLIDELGTGQGDLYNFALNGSCSNWILPGSNVSKPDAFVTRWETTTANESITIPTNDELVYDYTVDWGDGTLETGFSGDATHSYDTVGIYTVSIRGTFPRIHFNNANGTNTDKLKSIEQWGNIVWEDMEYAFGGCINMTYNATDSPDLSGVTSLEGMFYGCTSFNSGGLSNWDISTITDISKMFMVSEFDGDVSGWNTSSVTDMKDLFNGTPFNGTLENWDVSNVTNMHGVFDEAKLFNQDITGWDVTSVITMEDLFDQADAFNQDISVWDVSSVRDMEEMFQYTDIFNQDISGWDVSNVTDMEQMFEGAKAFNQDIGNWDVSKVRDMEEMFQDAVSFNQDIGNWDVSSATDMREMFERASAFNQSLGSWELHSSVRAYQMLDNCGMSVDNFDNTLTGWAGQLDFPDEVAIGVRDLKFCEGKLSRDFLILDKGWEFKGDAEDENCNSGECACDCHPNTSPLIPNTDGGLLTAAVKRTDGEFTHFCDNMGRLMLSISAKEAATIAPTDLTVNITPGTNYYKEACEGSGGDEDGNCFIQPGAAVILCHTWDVNSPETDATVRYYFSEADLDTIRNGMVAAGFSPKWVSVDRMWFYKVTSAGPGHEKPEDLAQNEVEVYFSETRTVSIPGLSLKTFSTDTTALGDYFAEYTVDDFSGGGGGGGDEGAPVGCPSIQADISGSTILASPGNGDVFVTIDGGTGPYQVALNDGTLVTSYNSGDPISVFADKTTEFYIVGLVDANECPAANLTGQGAVYLQSDDVTPPMALCQDVTVDIGIDGIASITVEDIDNGSVDNDSMATIVLNQYDFDCSSGGSDIVTLTAFDASGNSESCSAIVTINDPNDFCCPAVRNVFITPSGDTRLYEADQQIISDAEVLLGGGGTNIIYEAGNNVQLNSGFTVEQGAVFEAKIGPCGTN